MTCLPGWVVLHIPHDSTVIPEEVRDQMVLSDAELDLELRRITDHCTHAIFAEPPGEATVIRAPVSRLVVDVERFADDTFEPMAARGMGAIYAVTSQLAPLRRALSAEERTALLQNWYYPHHHRLEVAVSGALAAHGRCLIIDGHSFPGTAAPYERADPAAERPDICIGTDDFHTPAALARAFHDSFSRAGWRVALNAPFDGALVPSSRYHQDPRVSAVMVEVNRDLYLEPQSARPNADFATVAGRVRQCCVDALLALPA